MATDSHRTTAEKENKIEQYGEKKNDNKQQKRLAENMQAGFSFIVIMLEKLSS